VLLINKRELMGELVNGPIYNAITWATTGALILLTLVMIVTAFLT
jgi:Mn2+/Fe2+ NRAMP family transporter